MIDDKIKMMGLPTDKIKTAEVSDSALLGGSAKDLAETNKENAKLRKIIKEVWDMYENPSQVWWDSDLLMEIQEVAER